MVTLSSLHAVRQQHLTTCFQTTFFCSRLHATYVTYFRNKNNPVSYYLVDKYLSKFW